MEQTCYLHDNFYKERGKSEKIIDNQLGDSLR